MLFAGQAAFAIDPWNGDPADCAQIRIGTTATSGGAGCSNWGTGPVTAAPGGNVYIALYYHNTSSGTMTNTAISLSKTPGGSAAASSYYFNSMLSSDQSFKPSGNVTANITSAQSLTFVSAQWYPNQTYTTPTAFPFGQDGSEVMSGGVRLGSIGTGWSTQGSVVVKFAVGSPTPPPSTCTISSVNANPSTIVIPPGNSSQISWSNSNCTSVSISPAPGGGGSTTLSTNPSASTWVFPTSTTKYTITGSNSTNSSAVDVWVNVSSPATCTISNLVATPSSVTLGNSTQLSWNNSGCTTVSLSGYGSVGTGSYDTKTVTPTSTGVTTYTISGYLNGILYNSKSVQVTVTPVAACNIDNLTATPTTITLGQTINLAWDNSGCTSVFLSNYGSVGTGTHDTKNITPTVAGTFAYTITGYLNGILYSSKSVNVTVNPVVVNNTCVVSGLTASPSGSVVAGTAVTLYWTTSGNCGQLYINGVPVYGSYYTVYPNTGTTYTLTSSGNPVSVYVPVNAVNNTVPTATTNSPSNITNTSAALSGYVSGNGSTINGWLEFPCFGAQYGNVYGVTSSNLYATIYSLSPNTSYSYCAVAQNSATNTIVRANQVSFVTTGSNNNNNNLSVTTYSATNVSQTSATLNGYVDPGSSNNSATHWFRYGTTSGYLGMTTNSSNQGSGTHNMVDYISNLSPNTTYYFQAIAQNSYGTVHGSVQQFTTSSSFWNDNNAGQTSVMTTVATNVQPASASINGLLLNTTNAPTSVYFEYGTSVGLGGTTTQKYLGLGTSIPFSQFISGLAPNTIYYYRANAININGTARGTIEIFRTPGNEVNTNTNTNTTRTVYVNTGVTRTGLESPILLKIENRSEIFNIGDTVDYTVTYSNIGSNNLTKALLQVVLPKHVTFVNASRGTYAPEVSTLSVPLGDLAPQAGGVVYLQGRVNGLPLDHANIVTTAILVYTNPSGAQENAIAYVLNHDNNFNNLGASVGFFNFWGLGLLGWLLLLILILLIWLILRTYRNRYLYPREGYYAPYVAPHPANQPMQSHGANPSVPHT